MTAHTTICCWITTVTVLCASMLMSIAPAYGSKPNPPAMIVGHRDDRYGANGTSWMAAMLLSRCKGVPLYHACTASCSERWGHSVLHDILLEFCEKDRPPEHAIVLPIEHYFDLPQTCCALLHSDIPSALVERGLSSAWFSYFDRKAKEEHWVLRWNKRSSIVIHVRLDDCAPYNMNDGNPTSPHGELPYQGYIGDANLKSLIQQLHREFPQKNIYLITSPAARDIQRCRRIAMKFPYVYGVFGDTNVDYALWQMMCCDILVLSRSTFSMMAGLMHQGSRCYYIEEWKIGRAFLGQYDRGQWKQFP